MKSRIFASKIRPEKILVKIINVYNSDESRTDLSDSAESIQIILRNFKEPYSVAPHSHFDRVPQQYNANEVWVLISGTARADIFDVDDSFVASVELMEGDLAAFFNGGHSLTILNAPVKLLEFKSGPYPGVEGDKRNF